MPRYGPGQQSRSAPKPRKSGRAGPAAPARPKDQAQREAGIGTQPRPKRAPGSEAAGKAKLRQGSFDPSNREQQARLRQESQQEGQRVAAQRRRERVQRAAQSLYKQGRRKEAISLAEREGLGTGSHDPLGKFLSSGYGLVRKAEKIPVAGELIGMADPILLGKTAVRNIKALPKIGTSEYGKGQVNAGMAFGKGGEAPKILSEGALEPKKLEGSPPPVPAGHTRLYRGERAPGKEAPPGTPAATHGRWYTDHEQHARGYAGHHRGEKGSVYYIDVPAGEARAWQTGAGKRMSDNRRAAEHLVPESVTLKPPAVPLEDAAAAKVRESLGPARSRYAAQEGLRREERGKRIAAAKRARERAGGGEAGFEASKEELRGELPRVQFRNLREGKLSKDEYHTLLTQIGNHPGLSEWEKLPAQQALQNAFREGKVPRPHEVRHLETVFGQDAVKEILHTTKLVKAGKIAINVGGIPRSLMASYDISAPGRQGLIGGAAHPLQFAKTFKPMGRSLVKETKYDEEIAKLHADPDYDRFTRHGLNLTDLSGELGTREEPFPSSYAEKIPVVGRGVRASGRAYTGFLDVFRMKLAKSLVAYDKKRGVNTEDRAYLKKVMAHVNMETGRGRLGPVESWGPALNALFFSPRLAASRVEYLIKTVNPVWWAKASPGLRREMIRSYAGLGALVGGSIGTAHALGVGGTTVDPRSADFLKLKIGNTRIDLLGGISQYIRLAAEEGTQSTVSSTTGAVTKLGSKFGQRSGGDVLVNFLAQKLSPTASLFWYASHGKNYAGQPFNLKSEIASRLAPLSIQDAITVYQQTGNMPAAIAALSASTVGVGVQSYGPKNLRPNTGKFHDKRAEYLDAAKKTGLLPKNAALQPAEVRQAFALRESREIAYAKAGGHTLDQRGRFRVDQELLLKRKAITPAQAATGERWAKTASDKEIAAFRRQLGDKFFGTLILEGATRQINAHGGDVSLAGKAP